MRGEIVKEALYVAMDEADDGYTNGGVGFERLCCGGQDRLRGET